MCKLNISVKNNYVIINIKKKVIKYLVSPVLQNYISVKCFDKRNGVLTLIGKMNLLNGNTVTEEDWIDLNEILGFAFKNPQKLISEIESIELL